METDEKLIKKIVRLGSKRAADELIRRYYDEIYRFMYRQFCDREDALDMTQECFIAVLRGLPSFDAGKAGFRTWLYTVATNKVVDRRRKLHPIVVPFDDDQLPETEDIASKIADQELLGRIEEWVGGLDPSLQRIYRLHIYGDKTFKEIAKLSGEAEEKIKAQYYRMMKRLRKEFNV